MKEYGLDRERLRTQREHLRLSQHQLGVKIGHDQSYVSRLERGEISDITIHTLARLAAVLQVTTDYLLGLSETSARPTSRTPLPPRQPRTRTRRQSAVPTRPRTPAPVGSEVAHG